MLSLGYIRKGKKKGKRTATDAELNWRLNHENNSGDEIQRRVRPVAEIDGGTPAQATRQTKDRGRQSTFLSWYGMEWNGMRW